jgi:hypothetical protein
MPHVAQQKSTLQIEHIEHAQYICNSKGKPCVAVLEGVSGTEITGRLHVQHFSYWTS